MMAKKLSRVQYDNLFKEFLEEVGPNPASGFFATWAWTSTQKRKFNSKLRKEGFELPS